MHSAESYWADWFTKEGKVICVDCYKSQVYMYILFQIGLFIKEMGEKKTRDNEYA